jgi:hypothetical protein
LRGRAGATRAIDLLLALCLVSCAWCPHRFAAEL